MRRRDCQSWAPAVGLCRTRYRFLFKATDAYYLLSLRFRDPTLQLPSSSPPLCQPSFDHERTQGYVAAQHRYSIPEIPKDTTPSRSISPPCWKVPDLDSDFVHRTPTSHDPYTYSHGYSFLPHILWTPRATHVSPSRNLSHDREGAGSVVDERGKGRRQEGPRDLVQFPSQSSLSSKLT